MDFLHKHTYRMVILLFLYTFLVILPLTAHAVDSSSENPGKNLYAKAAVLMDAESGRILFSKNGEAVLPMASTTKIMTCILVLENGALSDYAKVSAYAASMPKVKLYARPNEFFRLEDLLYSLMLESHNDSAVILAEHIAGSTEAFADMMNRKARDLGCFQTSFITPNGLDATATGKDGTQITHSTTASDLARIMSYCILRSPEKEKFLQITGTDSYSFESYVDKDGAFVSGGRSFSCRNHNAFLGMMDGAFSGKTGFTGNAGYCYVGALQRDQRTFVVALLACGWPNNKSYKWSDTKTLMTYGLENFEHISLDDYVCDPSMLHQIPVLNGQTNKIGETAYTELTVNTSPKESADDRMDCLSSSTSPSGLLVKKGEKIRTEYEIAKKLTAPVKKNEPVGTVKYLLGNELCKIEYIVAANDIPAIDFDWCLHQIISRFLCSKYQAVR